MSFCRVRLNSARDVATGAAHRGRIFLTAKLTANLSDGGNRQRTSVDPRW